MSNNNNTNDPRITQTIIYLVLWILNMLKKKKVQNLKKNALRRFSAIFGPEINSLTCDFFIYEAILAFFFCVVCFDDILLHRVSKVNFGTNPHYPMHINFRWCQGGHALTCGLPVFFLKCFFLLTIW